MNLDLLKKPFELPQEFKTQFLPHEAVVIKGFNPDNLTFENFITVEIPDRDEEGLSVDGCDYTNFLETPVIGFAHFRDINRSNMPIGGCLNLRKEYHLKYNANGIVARSQLLDERSPFMNSVVKCLEFTPPLLADSVGFIPNKWAKAEDNDYWRGRVRRYCPEWQLLEYSLCPVVSNFASTLKIKSWFTPSELEELNIDRYITGTKTMVFFDDVHEEIDKSETIDVTKPYPNEHSCRLRNPDDFEDGSFRRTDRDHEGKKYSVIMGKLKGETTMTEQSYRYPKDSWTVAEARKHCKDHDGQSFEPAKAIELEFTKLQEDLKAAQEEVIALKDKIINMQDEYKLMQSNLSAMTHERNNLLKELKEIKELSNRGENDDEFLNTEENVIKEIPVITLAQVLRGKKE